MMVLHAKLAGQLDLVKRNREELELVSRERSTMHSTLLRQKARLQDHVQV